MLEAVVTLIDVLLMQEVQLSLRVKALKVVAWNLVDTVAGEKGEPAAREALERYKGDRGRPGAPGEPGLAGVDGRPGKHVCYYYY